MGVTASDSPGPVRYSSSNPVPTHWAQLSCIDLVNSRWTDHRGSGEVFDRLQCPQWLPALQEHWGLQVEGEVDLQGLRSLRQLLDRALRSIAQGRDPDQGDMASLNSVLAEAPLWRRIESDGSRSWMTTAPRVRDQAWLLGEIVASVEPLLAQGLPGRLKVCQNQHCSWMFQDESRNRTRRWCDESVCGNLVKVRRFRATRGKPQTSPPPSREG